MRNVVILALIGIALAPVGFVGVVTESTHFRVPGANPTPDPISIWLVSLYAGLASLALSLVLLVRHVWRRYPGNRASLAFVIVGAGLTFVGTAVWVQPNGTTINQVLIYSGLALVAAALALAFRKALQRT
jgi:hypothetical protein